MANEGPPLSPSVLRDSEFSKETRVQQRGSETTRGRKVGSTSRGWSERGWQPGSPLATQHTMGLPQEHLLSQNAFKYTGGLGACCLGVTRRAYAPPSANTVSLWGLPPFKCLHISYTRKSHGPSCHKLNTTLKQGVQKREQYKK